MNVASQSVESTLLVDRLVSGKYLKTARGKTNSKEWNFERFLQFCSGVRYISCTRDPDSGQLIQENLECPGDLVFANE